MSPAGGGWGWTFSKLPTTLQYHFLKNIFKRISNHQIQFLFIYNTLVFITLKIQ